jgi:hypothetical protein
VFNPGASAYTITARPHALSGFNEVLTIGGAGIINNSGVTQNFVTADSPGIMTHSVGEIEFTGSASAGKMTVITNNGDVGTGFADTSAAAATINNNPGNRAPGRRDRIR